MRVIVDADSLVYASCFNVETLGEAKEKFSDSLDAILSDLTNVCDVDDIRICNGSKNNFRVALNKSYKANRTQERPTFLGDMHDWVKSTYNSYWTSGYETDDVVATLWKQSVDELGEDGVIIASMDKDYKQFPCWYFDTYWSRRELMKIDEFEAKYNFYAQMIIGDSADNVNYIKGKGKGYVRKLFKGKKSVFGLLKATYNTFKDEYGVEAKAKFRECEKLLKLETNVKEIQQAN